ncbi:Uncharacterised protein [uncultured archaeon]|nr:Uncharacterised protein [uncultured archaeon]
MRGSVKNGKIGNGKSTDTERTDTELRVAVEELVVKCANAKDRDDALRRYGAVVEGIMNASGDLAHAGVTAVDCMAAGMRKRYEARYYADGNGINGNLVRSWDGANCNADEEADASPPP